MTFSIIINIPHLDKVPIESTVCINAAFTCLSRFSVMQVIVVLEPKFGSHSSDLVALMRFENVKWEHYGGFKGDGLHFNAKSV